MSDQPKTLDDVVVKRFLDAAPEMVWRLWTEPEHFKKWYGPQGFTVPVARFTLEINGERTVCMEMASPDGSTMKMWTTGVHEEITPSSRLAYTESMADEHGNILDMPGYPKNTRVTVDLVAHGAGTHMRVTQAGLPEGAGGAEIGWSQAFDKMVDYLKSMPRA